MAELIVALALLGVGEDLICLGGLLELLGRVLVALVAVGVVLHREFAIGLLDIVGRCVAGDAKHLVVVAFLLGHGYASVPSCGSPDPAWPSSSLAAGLPLDTITEAGRITRSPIL